MPIRGEQPFRFVPSGLTDSTDGTDAPPGSLALCTDIIVSQTDAKLFVPRTAAQVAVDLTAINPNGVISCFIEVGDLIYGMISSAAHPGKDEPFCANRLTGALFTVSGVASGLLPNTIPQTGDWVPPTMIAIGGRIIVTHPGFTGGTNPYFGWFDISSFSSTIYAGATLGNTTTGSPLLDSLVTPIGTSAPILSGYQPGMTVSGAGIPTGTVIETLVNGTFSLGTKADSTLGSNDLTNVVDLTGVKVGMAVAHPNVPAGAHITAIVGTTVTFSGSAATATGTALATTFTGGGTITMSQNATATADLVALTIAGGTPSAPLWGAGNTNTNPLTAVPRCVGGFNGRTWYGVKNFAIYSDILNPTQVSFATQALTVGDPSDITVMDSVPLTSQLTGGVQQSLTIYKGAGSFFQVTGDPLTANLALNAVTGSVGTNAPGTIGQTPQGALAVAADGVRLLALSGTQTQQIGGEGSGVAAPFISGILPSRMSADYADGVYRVSVAAPTTAYPGFDVTSVEYWLHTESGRWTGPHSFPSQLVKAASDGTGFYVTSWLYPATIFRSDVNSEPTSSYTELRVQGSPAVKMTWAMQSTPLPDNEDLAYVQIVRANLSCQMANVGDLTVSMSAQDPGNSQSTCTLRAMTASSPVWGTSVWGAFLWGGTTEAFKAKPLYFDKPVVGRQIVVSVSCTQSAYGQKLGAVNAGVQLTGYNSPVIS